jgi:hypothetical protein
MVLHRYLESGVNYQGRCKTDVITWRIADWLVLGSYYTAIPSKVNSC